MTHPVNDPHGVEVDADEADIWAAAEAQAGTVDEQNANYVGDEELNNSACRWCEDVFDTVAARRDHSCQGRRAYDRWEPDEQSIIQPSVHELGANLLFAGEKHGLSPFFAIHSVFKRLMEGNPDPVEYDGESWRIWFADDGDDADTTGTKFWQGKIAGRLEDSFEAYQEYQIKLVCQDDLEEQQGRSVTFQFRPSFSEMQHVEDGKSLGVPDDLPEGIRVTVLSSNIAMDEVTPLLRSLADHIGVRPRYFRDDHLHEWSRVFNLATYVRVDRDLSEDRIVGPDGLLENLARFGARREGRGEYKWDNEEIMGHRNAVAMDEQQWSKLLPSRSAGCLLKSYHMKNPMSDGQSAVPTYHPKLEAQYSTEYSNQSSVSWPAVADEHDYDARDLQRELEHNVQNALHWAGIPVVGEGVDNAYVEDQYFAAETAPQTRPLYEASFDAIEETERDLATQHALRDDASPAERDVLEALADGGQLHVDDMVDETQTSESTVYRALDRFKSVVKRTARGEYAMEDDVVRDQFQRLFRSIERHAGLLDRDLEDIAADVDVLETADSPFARWMQTYGVDADCVRGELDLDVVAGEYSKLEIRQVLRHGLQAAQQTGTNLLGDLIDATVHWSDPDDGRTSAEPYQWFGSALKVLGADATAVD